MLRRLLRIVAVVLAGTAVLAGAYVWDANRFPARDVPVAGTPFTMRVQDGLGRGEIAVFRRGLLASQRWLARHAGGAVKGRVEARMAHGDPCEPFLDPGGGSTGVADDGWLCIDTLTAAWRENVRDRPSVATGVPAHELVHVWQAELGCLPGRDDREYLWLTEGTATAFAWWALEDAGLERPRGVEPTIRRWGAFDRRVGALRSYERSSGSDPEYALWHLAVRDLLRRTQRGPEAVRAFCMAAGDGTPWRRAFATAFGMEVDDFYRAFETARAAYRSGDRAF